jgi:hypothetical protein
MAYINLYNDTFINASGIDEPHPCRFRGCYDDGVGKARGGQITSTASNRGQNSFDSIDFRNQSGCNSQYYNQAGRVQGVQSTTPKPSTFRQRMDNFGCSGLNSRRAILQARLNGLQSAGTNPRWTTILQNKIKYIDNKLRVIRC